MHENQIDGQGSSTKPPSSRQHIQFELSNLWTLLETESLACSKLSNRIEKSIGVSEEVYEWLRSDCKAALTRVRHVWNRCADNSIAAAMDIRGNEGEELLKQGQNFLQGCDELVSELEALLENVNSKDPSYIDEDADDC